MTQSVGNPRKDFTWVEKNFLEFEKNLNGGLNYPLHQKRKNSFINFQKTGFPTSEQEEWKYTDPQVIKDTFFSLTSSRGNLDSVDKYITPDLDSYKIVFVDGLYCEPLSSSKFEPGLAITNIAAAQKPQSSFFSFINDTLGTIASSNDPFVTINTSFVTDGVIIHISKSAIIEKPIEILFVTTKKANNASINPRVLLVADENSEVKVIEKYLADDFSTGYLNNSVGEFIVAKNAKVDHYRLQEESTSAFHISTIQVRLEEGSVFRSHTFSFGSKMARNNLSFVMNGPGCNCTMNGLSVLNGQQHVDNTTLLDHAKPFCQSLELYKGIYAGSSQGVFSGTIIVRPDAQKTNAIQSNRSLLLSEQAQVNTKPQLKIWADDVKCTHGATVGQLDKEALFYIRSRGVGIEEAKKLLIKAFAGEILELVKIPQLVSELLLKIDLKLETIL